MKFLISTQILKLGEICQLQTLQRFKITVRFQVTNNFLIIGNQTTDQLICTYTNEIIFSSAVTAA